MDGKHFRIQKPSKSGSAFYNYKGFFSVAIMAVVDHDYRFRMVDVGGLGSDHDGGFLKETGFGQALYGDGNDLNWPEDKALPGTDIVVPHFLIGDDAFQLSERLMKPFPGRGLSLEKKIYNYRYLGCNIKCCENFRLSTFFLIAQVHVTPT